MIYLIEGNKESIKHIDFFEEILPKILIVSNSNRTINLFDYENGEYIDSLRQIIDNSLNVKKYY